MGSMPKLKRGHGISQSSLYASGKQKKLRDKFKSAVYRKKRKLFLNRSSRELSRSPQHMESDIDSVSSDPDLPDKSQV